ncbi:MAG: phosphomannomutase/phosphoglucomutase [Sebaldella sp.]|nr:phosphomannomutase/phosphoglucomutase [Sebaldella sp.]
MEKVLGKLQSGSDIRGIAIQYEDKEVNLSRENVGLIAKGYIAHISEKLGKSPEDIKVSVGTDPRLTASKLKCKFIEELMDSGMEVYDFGISTTPSMFMSTVFEKYTCDSAVMFTASHLPFYYNGMKFFTKDGGFEKEDIKQLISLASVNNEEQKIIKKGKMNKTSILKDYSSFLVDKIRKEVDSKSNYMMPLEGLHIIVDAGNGSGGFFAKEVLEPLGANTEGSAFLEPDGNFPNHIPNPEDEKAIGYLKKAVIDNKADLGIIFDTDVDRSSCVDKNGEEINRNRLIALSSAIVLEQSPGSTIVTDSITSTELSEFITKLGGKHFRFQRGYKNVINKAKDLNEKGIECQLAIETSGHAAFKENRFLDDGAYLVAKILIKLAKLHENGQNIEDLLTDYKEPKESKEVRLKMKTQSIKESADKIIKDLDVYTKEMSNWSQVEENYEGIRVNCEYAEGKGWFLLRSSLHEPILCINIESDFSGGVEKILSSLGEFLRKYDEVDTSGL